MARPALDDVDLVLTTMARTIVDNADYFAQLDSVVGDGDFGYSLRNGFEVVVADYDTFDHVERRRAAQEDRVRHVRQGRRVSGPDLGHRVPACRRHAGDKPELDREDVIAMLRAAIAGIMQRGSRRSATRRCSMRWSRPSTASRRASPIRPTPATALASRRRPSPTRP